MTRIRFALVCVIVLIAAGLYAVRVKRSIPPPTVVAAAPAAEPVTRAPRIKPRPIPYTGSAFIPTQKYSPGTYIPAGFAANFRDHIKGDFADMITTRLGKPLSPAREAQVEAVQDAFWDDHGPDVDLFKEGKIGQPEFAERTHRSTLLFANGMSKIFDDADYQKLFDMPKDVDPFYQLYHSQEEQPGMPVGNNDAPTPLQLEQEKEQSPAPPVYRPNTNQKSVR